MVFASVTRRRALWLMGGLTGGLLLHACSREGTSSSETKPLISGVTPWPGYAGQYVALQQGLFQQEGVNVQDIFFQSASEGITGFLAGKTDVSWMTSGDAIEIIHKDPTVRIIYVVDYSNGSDGIIGRGIQQPSDLKGKTVARENLLFENVLLYAYLEKAGLTPQDIEIKDMTAGDAAAAFAAKRVDAAVSYEPWLTKAAKEGGGEVIFSTKDTNLIADVIATRQKVIEERESDLKAYLRSVDRAVKLVNSGDTAAIQAVADKLGVSLEEAKTQLAGVKVLDLAANKSMAFNPDDPNNVMKNFELNVDTAYATKLLPEKLEIAALYNDAIVKSL